MKYLKLFEEYIKEEDPLAGLMGGGAPKPKEDPLEKKKKEEKAREKRAKEKHEEYVDKKGDKIEGILKKLPDVVDEKLGDKIRQAIKLQDRVKIHNAALDITYLQQDYAMKGNDDMVARLAPLKDYVDDLDRSYTGDKMM